MRKFIFNIFLFFPLIIFSQLDSITPINEYIEVMNNNLNIKLEFDNDVEAFKFDDGITSFTVKPNTNLRTTLSANYQFLTLKVGYSPNFLNFSKDADKKGDTKIFKLNMDLFMKNWMQTLQYSVIKGYFIDNYESSSNTLDLFSDDYILLPNMKSKKFTATTRYKFNDNFSFKAIFNQYEIQRKSAGSFVPSFIYSYLSISDRTGNQDIQTSNFVLTAGYFYTFVINKKWYSALGIAPGLGLEFNKLDTRTEEGTIRTANNEFTFNISTELGVGYNSKSFFSGIALKGVAINRDKNNVIKFNNERGILLLFVGYRFKSPKFMKKGFDWLEEKNPF